MDVDFYNGTDPNLYGRDDLDLLESEGMSGERYVLEMKNPEEMKNPASLNPFFFHIIITHSVTFVIGILGNIFVVIVMVGDRKSRNPTNLFLVSLAVSDLLLLLICVPLETLQYFVIQWNEDGMVCKITRYVELLSAAANVLTLCAVSLERFIVIVFPMRSRSLCTISNCRRVIFIVWLIALILSTPVIPAKSGYSVIYRNSTTNVSVQVFYCKDENTGLSLAIYKFVVLFGAPGLLMLICYTYVIRELWRSTRNINLLTNAKSFHGGSSTHSKNIEDTKRGVFRRSNTKTNMTGLAKSSTGRGEGKSSEEKLLNLPGSKKGTGATSGSRVSDDIGGDDKFPRSSTSLRPPVPLQSPRQRSACTSTGRLQKGDDAKKARRQVIKMLILVIILFLVCWGPKLILPIGLEIANIFGFDYWTQEWYLIRIIFHLIPFLHSCMNPVIYSAMRRSTRRQIQRLCLAMGCMNCGRPTVMGRGGMRGVGGIRRGTGVNSVGGGSESMFPLRVPIHGNSGTITTTTTVTGEGGTGLCSNNYYSLSPRGVTTLSNDEPSEAVEGVISAI